MKHLTIALNDELFDELLVMAADSAEVDESDAPSPERFATECVESVLASRRLKKFAIA